MGRKLIAVAVVVVTAVTVAAVAAAGPASAKQRVAISVKAVPSHSFVLTPLTPGAIQRDSGSASFCCWSVSQIVRDGQAIEINDPQMTLTGKRGTLVARNRIGFVDVPDGLAVFTGTWKVISGTGAYAGLAGGGRGAGVMLTNGNTTSQFEGFLSPK